MENTKIEVPNFEDYLPLKDSVLGRKLEKSMTWARIYIYICNKVDKDEYKVTTKEISDIFAIDYSIVYRRLIELSNLGYLKVIKKGRGRGGETFFVVDVGKSFIKEDFIKKSKKCLESEKL